jgi:hypothetical protein
MQNQHNWWADVALGCAVLSLVFIFLFVPFQMRLNQASRPIVYGGGTIIVLAIVALRKRRLGGVARAWTACIIGIFETLIGAFLWGMTRACGPSVYSFNGKKYVFDCEPYAGAIMVKQTRFTKLNYLAPVNGRFWIKMINELNEIQYTDYIKLLVVEHPSMIDVVPDIKGQIHTIQSPLAPTYACHQHGKDILHLIRPKGDGFWESTSFEKIFGALFGRREKLILEFPKNPNATRAKLVLTLSNTLWSSSISNKFLQVFGKSYLAMSVVRSLARKGFIRFEVQAWENDEWKTQGWVRGTSPHLPKAQVIPLDLSAISGECLKLRLLPAAGFWRIDTTLVDYSDEVPVRIVELDPVQAINHCSEDILKTLLVGDDRFYIARKGDYAIIAFDEPSIVPNTSRTFILKATGYYKTCASTHERKVNSKNDSRLKLQTEFLQEAGPIARAVSGNR